MARSRTLTVSTFYMIAQMVGAGTLVALLLKDSGITYQTAVIGVGVLMIVYVVFGGMLATTWVQIIKAILLMGGTILLSILVLAHFDFSFGAFFDAIAQVTYTNAQGKTVTNFLTPGLRYKPPYGALDLISLGLALIFGTAGLPHILVRFYTVPDAKTARVSVVWAMADHRHLLHHDHVPRLRRGHHRRPRLHRRERRHQHERAAARAGARGRRLLRVHLARSPSPRFWPWSRASPSAPRRPSRTTSTPTCCIAARERREGEEVRVARITAFVVGAVSIAIAILLGPTANVAFLVGLAFAVAASANLPVIVLSMFWRRFNTAGAVCGLATGLASSLVLIVISPSIMGGGRDLSARESRHRQHPAGIPRCRARHAAQARAASRAQVHRTERAREHRPRRRARRFALERPEPYARSEAAAQRSVGPRIRVLEPGHAEVEIPDRRSNRQHLGSVHAIALMNWPRSRAGSR